MKLSRHGKKRLRGRMGLSGSAPERIAQRAFESGVPVAGLTGRLRRYLDGQMIRHRSGNNTRVLGEAVFVFQDDTLVTVYQLPRDLREAALAAQERHREVLA